MIITICGSMSFGKEMLSTKEQLENMGHKVFVPGELEGEDISTFQDKPLDETVEAKIENDFIRAHYGFIVRSDAILVLNHTKNGIENYVGGNSFLEMGFAFVHGKKIFLLNDVPTIIYESEMKAMQPTILRGDLSLIS